MDGWYIHAFAFGRSTEWFSSPPFLLHSDDCKDYEHFRQCMAILLEHEFESRGTSQRQTPTYLKGPRTFDLLLNIGFYDGVCLIACQPRPITYFEPKFSTLARKLHQTEINSYIISYILHLLLFLLKCCCFLNSLPDPIRSQITGNAAVPTCLASVTLALCSILALWLH